MKIGFVKDAFGGVPHVMATENDGHIEVKSITEYGKSIINDFDFDSKNISRTIPDGFIFTGFFEKTSASSESKTETKLREKSFSYVGSFESQMPTKGRTVSNAVISKFSTSVNKLNAVAFKASAFKNSTKRSEFLNRINSGKVLFDQRLARIAKNPKFAFSHVEEEIIRDSFGDGFIRKAAEKGKSNRRVSRRARVLANLNDEKSSSTKKNILLRIDKARKDVKNGR